jgi:hypothetical protein
MRWTIVVCALLGLATLQDSTSRIHKQGLMAIPIDFAADFDEGRIGTGGDWYDADRPNIVVIHDWVNESPLPENGYFRGSDFWFESGKHKFLRPQHGAKFFRGIVSSTDYKACAGAAYSGNALRVDNLAAGSHVCMRTSEGRFTNITIRGYNPATLQFTLAYVTWEK